MPPWPRLTRASTQQALSRRCRHGARSAWAASAGCDSAGCCRVKVTSCCCLRASTNFADLCQRAAQAPGADATAEHLFIASASTCVRSQACKRGGTLLCVVSDAPAALRDLPLRRSMSSEGTTLPLEFSLPASLLPDTGPAMALDGFHPLWQRCACSSAAWNLCTGRAGNGMQLRMTGMHSATVPVQGCSRCVERHCSLLAQVHAIAGSLPASTIRA